MIQSEIALIVGLGNPGNQYSGTRHNVGFSFLDRMQSKFKFRLAEKKFKAEVGYFKLAQKQIMVAAPLTFMNLSGQSVAPLASCYRIKSEQILIVHDELYIPAGSVQLQSGGGHGGHNGLRNIIPELGSYDFFRLRIGIGHPGPQKNISSYVLGKPTYTDRLLIEDAINETIDRLPSLLCGEFQPVINRLHTEKTKDLLKKERILWDLNVES